jgi:hypothetical protein
VALRLAAHSIRPALFTAFLAPATITGFARAETSAALEAQAAYTAGRFDEARALWTPLAEAGDPAAAFSLGVLYDIGQGVPADPATAFYWYRRAADAGHSAAEFNVAVMEDSGQIGPRNITEAAVWYGRAAARGNHRAEYNLGLLYAAGDGVPRNPDLALAWYRAAAVAIPAAAARLTALQNARPRPAPDAAGAPLVPAETSSPPDGTTILAWPNPTAVELVWTAAAQPSPSHFFVEVMALAPSGPGETVFADFVETSAILVPLSSAPASYAWRVYTVGKVTAHYAVGSWARFTVAARD